MGIGSVRPSNTFALAPFALGISNKAYRQAQRGDDELHFLCRQCEERNWQEITDTDADEGAITSTDK
ncbi:hypothetical protein DPMN_145084 [Dreissena polymorpha]|uniref:Uncharacterized protein n=1 Tax=Dreissena polymorpha TaxID=45954 RepID=A0A9D4F5A0_DREPO|nr:hypothetical protein DPMN_145084 [Dreissena polymorpha]